MNKLRKWASVHFADTIVTFLTLNSKKIGNHIYEIKWQTIDQELFVE